MSEIKNLIGDISKLGSNAAAIMFESSQEFTAKLKEQVRNILPSMNLITREEFDVVKQLAEKNALENIELKKKIEELEKTAKAKKKDV